MTTRVAMTRVAVVGGGASGAIQALHLKRAGISDVALIERARIPGRGAAYSTRRPEHLLNVPARRMSAFADDPDHFSHWYGALGLGSAESFAPRMVYGDYLVAQLGEAGIEAIAGEAVDLEDGAVRLADGRRLAADVVVLAPGNLRPAVPRGIDPGALGTLWIGDPWAGEIGAGLVKGDKVLLLGTGLTAVDVALTLDAEGFAGRILALSRRGLAPRSHGAREPLAAPAEALPAASVALLRRVRARSREVGWRAAVYELRNVTQDLWGRADPAERRRFLRHLRPWWDVHRHKLAPAVGERIDAMKSAGRLAIAAGRLLGVEAEAGQAVVRFRARGSDETELLRVGRIVNCTGPESDLARAGDPLLDALIAAGRIRPDPLQLGLDVDLLCRALGADGAPTPGLYALGPVTRGTFWESVAVPDIRCQAARIAEQIAGR